MAIKLATHIWHHSLAIWQKKIKLQLKLGILRPFYSHPCFYDKENCTGRKDAAIFMTNC